MSLTSTTILWGELAAEECGSMPLACLLRLVHRESRGVAGLKSGKPTKSGYAYGLTQVNPATLDFYNANHPSHPIKPESLRGKDSASARLQLRAGAWVWSWCYKTFSGQAKGSEWDRAAFADLAYAKGVGAFRQLLRDASIAGVPMTLAGLKAFRPNWTGSEDPFGHAEFIAAGTGEAVPGVQPIPPEAGGLLLAVLVLVGVLSLLTGVFA